MREPTEAEIKKFERAAKAMAKLGESGLYLYLANDTLNLMSGPSHDEKHKPCFGRVMASVRIPNAGGGDW